MTAGYIPSSDLVMLHNFDHPDNQDALNEVSLDNDGLEVNGNVKSAGSGNLASSSLLDRSLDQYYSVGGNASLNMFNSAFTVLAWVEPIAAADGANHYIFAKKDGGSAAFPYALFRSTGLAPDGWSFMIDSGIGDGRINSSVPVVLNQRTLVAGAYDGVSKLFIKVDKNPVETQLTTRTITDLNTNPAFIGNADPAPMVFTWGGLLYQVMLYRRVISAAEYRRIYNGGLGTEVVV